MARVKQSSKPHRVVAPAAVRFAAGKKKKSTAGARARRMQRAGYRKVETKVSVQAHTRTVKKWMPV